MDHYSLVCAMHFGNTSSGIAYSLKREYCDDPMRITVPDWNAPSSVQISYKTPTTILLDSERKFVAFGYEAESKYAEFAEDEEHDEYFLCRRFKMLLNNTMRREEHGLQMTAKIADITEKKEMLAIDIFSLSIKYFRDLMVYTVDKKGIGVKTTDIRWVLTVPAMWSDPAKQFMTEAAERAGIPRANLVLALESEAASIYCSRLLVTSTELDETDDIFGDGKKYLIIAAKGEVVVFTVHEVTKDHHLKELAKASSGDCGGTCVDNDYKNTLTEILGEDFLEEFRLKYTGEYIELFQDFEMKKRTPLSENQTMITMRIPGMLSGFYEERKNQKLKEAFKNSTYNKSTRFEGDKVRITPALMKCFFASACVGIVDHVRDLLLEKLKHHKIDTIIMVGGFSESPILQAHIRSEFPDHRVVVPKEARLAVLRGAVLFGHNPSIISERMAKGSHGIASF
ncbi:heat shock 70 kDa protein 12A-like isoform X2 [Magallana gigas]